MADLDSNLSDIRSELFSAYIAHRNTLRSVCLSLYQVHELFDVYEGGNAEEVGNLLSLYAEQLEKSLVSLTSQLLNRGAPPQKAGGSDLVIDSDRGKS
jgi:hypothetical protein